MVTTNEKLKEIQALFFTELAQCDTAGDKVKVFQAIKALHVSLKSKVCNNEAFNEITRYLQDKTSCMNLCGGVCENLCHLNAQELNHYIKRNNLDDRLIMTPLQFHS